MVELQARSFVPISSSEARAKDSSNQGVRRDESLGSIPRAKEGPTQKNTAKEEASRKDASSAKGSLREKPENSESNENFESKLERAKGNPQESGRAKELSSKDPNSREREVPTGKNWEDLNLLDTANLIALQQNLSNRKEAEERHPILKFMDSMENEFGIEPERLIEAFGGLTQQELVAKPEVSADAFIENLEISPKDQWRAKELYSKLLSDLNLRNQKLGESQAEMPLEIQSLLREMKPVRQENLTRPEAVEALSRKFFEVYPNQFGRPLAQDSEVMSPLASKGLVQNADGSFHLANPETYTQLQNLADPANSEVEAEDSSSVSKLAGGFGALALAKDLAPEKGANLTDSVAEMASAGTDAADGPDWMKQVEVLNATESEETDGFDALDADLSEGGDESFDSSSSGPDTVGGLASAKNQGAESFAKLVGTGAAVDSEASAANSQSPEEIVTGVQYLAKKGGGEMKVQMNHDDMGEVHLKVAVHEGKVDIQVMTESKEAKKLLESELSYLKTDLSDKKIDLNEIKVEVAKDMRGMMQDQLADQRRQETMQFWKQFREENEAMRSSALNMGLSSYKKSRPNQMPSEAAQAYKARNLNSRLDIVA